MSGQRGPGVVEQWHAFGAYPPVKRAAARAGLVVTTAVISVVMLAAILLAGRGLIALFIAGWRATGW